MTISFLDRYNSEVTWSGKVIVMEIYHLTMGQRNKSWTISETAQYFQCSVGLVSENLRLANSIHNNPKMLIEVSRQDALRRLKS